MRGVLEAYVVRSEEAVEEGAEGGGHAELSQRHERLVGASDLGHRYRHVLREEIGELLRPRGLDLVRGRGGVRVRVRVTGRGRG